MDFFVAATRDGRVLSVARADGPLIQILSHAGAWVDQPGLLTRLHDAGYYERVSEDDALLAARSLCITPATGRPCD
jgi:hypothetical protein